MKKLFRIFIILSITVLFTSCGQEATTYEAKEALSKHLIERYGEEFEIGYMGRRSDGKEVWYEAEIYPSKYVGTPKERDKYYRESGTVNIKKGIFGEKLGKAGDTYGIVKVNESAEEFYGKKLKELFGNNVLQVYDIWFNRILEDYSFENIIKVSDEERTALIIKGGIYIFGRVENDEEREWYRKQIYEFIQFMKETGTFEYVDLGITVIDERELIDVTNPRKYIKDLSNNLDKETWRKERRRLMKKANDEFQELSKEKIKERINSLNKGKYDDSDYVNLLFIHIYSPKYIESKGWNKSNRTELYEEVKKYNVIEDISFKLEWW
ncbi:hypothetical protein C4N20_13740 [Fusobacterium ulcerans]|uniref:YARHG domain-containing protein n=1 Tax=Fusobacterium ulcerans TaxID=861 RepID=A0AAX2JB34_9FUSO|nr:hypothetical protein [Fusobacterium ulcerans]AVQ29103.1 hypothetical protein C4N20_13740 [Fusobacterium ulcerans]EJZ44691.1 hypothetical protein FUAG_03300 [Fusobacterium ulcerans ATCC 49185]SQJ02371.1 Uncharacterised protein [Fusobacterium ulcerans]